MVLKVLYILIYYKIIYYMNYIYKSSILYYINISSKIYYWKLGTVLWNVTNNLLTLLQYGHSPNMMLKLCLLVSSPLNHWRDKKRGGMSTWLQAFQIPFHSFWVHYIFMSEDLPS